MNYIYIFFYLTKIFLIIFVISSFFTIVNKTFNIEEILQNNCILQNVNIQKVKIGINAITIKGGGRARITALFLNYLSKCKLFQLFLFNIFEVENEYRIPKDVIRIKIIRDNPKYLIDRIKRNHIDIFIYQLSFIDEIKKLNELKGVKVIYYLHSSIFYYFYSLDFAFYKNLYKEYKNCKYLVNLVNFENDFLFRKWNITSIIIDNFVTYEYDSINPSDLSSQMIIMIGRNEIIKKFQLGILSMKYIVSEIPNSTMKILLDMKDYRLTDLIYDLQLKKNIELIENNQNPEIFFMNASLHIFPSFCESFGLVLSEAKLFGIPSILLGLDYLSLSKGGTVIIYDDSPESIAKEAIKILNNKDYRIKLGKEARESMKSYSNEKTSKSWIELILSVYNGDKYYKLLRQKKKYLSINQSLFFYNKQFNLLKRRIDYFQNFTLESFDNFFGI